ncbi:MAG: ATP synthase F0 subunit C [Candidatus Coatesbacteria bacterium]|nr:MAG: ATP synthase F0 subunit C [Candidatus Coatesbacteria bacterium]
MNKAIILAFAFGLLFAFAGTALAAGEHEELDVEVSETSDELAIAGAKGFAYAAIAAVFAMAIAAFGAALGQARAANAALDGTARQPEASGKLMIQMLLAIVFMETLAIYTLVLGLIIMFVNPLKGLFG